MERKISASAFILTKNSAGTIPHALESLRDFHDVVVCDGGSSDDTVRIAKEFGASVIAQDARYLDAEGNIVDFGAIRNSCLMHLRYPWVFYIDSDEYISSECVEEIRRIVQRSFRFLWWVPRRYMFRGEEIDCTTSYPNRQIRLFHREHTRGFIKPVHERIEPLPGEPIGIMRYPIFVPLQESGAIRKRTAHYLMIESQELYLARRKVILRRMIHTLRASLVHLARMPRYLFCRGKRAPFFYEYARHEYNFRLFCLLTKKLLWK